MLFRSSGPDPLGHLDAVTVAVANDDRNRVIINPGLGATQEDVDAHVWGPWRFAPHTDDADRNGRAVAPVPLQLGRGRPFTMERTRPGHWMRGTDQAAWQQQYADHPIRLLLTCRQGDERWVIARQIPNPPLGEQ